MVYDLNGYGTPFSFKSEYLVRLYGHVRHPSLLAFVALLWVTNVMRLAEIDPEVYIQLVFALQFVTVYTHDICSISVWIVFYWLYY